MSIFKDKIGDKDSMKHKRPTPTELTDVGTTSITYKVNYKMYWNESI